MATTHSLVSKMFAIAMVAFASLFLVACGGGTSEPPPITCPAGQTLVGTTCTPNSVPDTTPPTVTITEPADGAKVYGTITLTATASDSGSGVNDIDVSAKGAGAAATIHVCTMSGASPSCPWDTNKVAEGTYTVSFTANDKAGNPATKYVTVTVANKAPEVVCTATPELALRWGDLKNNRPVKAIPTTSGLRNGYINLFVQDSACWSEVIDSTGSHQGAALLMNAQYNRPVVSNGTFTLPTQYGDLVVLFQ